MSALGDLIRQELERRGWGQRELAETTDAVALKYGFVKKGKSGDRAGLAQSTISEMSQGRRQTEIENLYLVALSFAEDGSDSVGGWLFRMLQAIGYPLASMKGIDERRARALAIIESSASLDLIERVARATPDQQRAIEAFLVHLQGNKQQN